MMRDRGRPVRPSLLDRLVDEAPGEAADPAVGLAESKARFERSVLRDLEWLLNTRQTLHPGTRAHPELRRSVHNYGVPDVTSLSADSQDSRTYLMERVREAIRFFEPRLQDVEVELLSGEKGDRLLRIRIEGTLLMEDDAERIVFDTVLETTSGSFSVES
ncbi:MAG: type VI secretion system baseplate subunit TssE [Gemmatimonadales bacterium]|nr:MAG: type VI secretion system baseplate subunit TssE [Gemmatimonadales bacterium]